MSFAVRAVFFAAFVALLPSLAYAQASVTGVVRDASGAVLPGVTVEAASPALIEKVRSTVTGDTGQFRIENLRNHVLRQNDGRRDRVERRSRVTREQFAMHPISRRTRRNLVVDRRRQHQF